MSDVTSHYIVRAKNVAMAQYESLRSTLGKVMQRSDWVVNQRSFIEGARSLNEAELKENLEYFKVPSASLELIRTKLAMTIFDEYANILKGMYSTRFNGRVNLGGTLTRPATGRPDHGEAPPAPLGVPRLLSSTPSQRGSLIKLGSGKKEGVKSRKSN